jgi:hypothetical protein
LEEAPAGTRAILRKRLINKLNYLHFLGKPVHLVFKHTKTHAVLKLPVSPQPCKDESLVCQWNSDDKLLARIINFQYQYILLSDGHHLICLRAELQSIDEKRIRFRLPEAGYEISSRKTRRYLCQGISVQMVQNSVVFCGKLTDFNASSFSILIELRAPQTFRWIDPNAGVNLMFFKGDDVIYSGDCIILRHVCQNDLGQFVLAPKSLCTRRFPPKKYRSERVRLVPSPDIRFQHPLTGQWMVYSVCDLSGSGVAVETGCDRDVLLPGMLIPEISLQFADGLCAPFQAQVIYRQNVGENDGVVRARYGLAILDMALDNHVRLLNLIHRVSEPNAYFCNPLDMDMLWHFFFESGFIYPQKYAFVHANKDIIKRTYQKLYLEHPHIAHHFVYQVDGRILGHMAMLRFYANTWLIHHHAARTTASIRAGLVVLQQVVRFINDSHQLFSMHMNYVMCYFQPENKFPKQVFMGAARHFNDKKLCSVDLLAYFHCVKAQRSSHVLVSPWTLATSRSEDIEQLADEYAAQSGGLMISCLDLFLNRGVITEELAQEYRLIGLKRQYRLFSLKRAGQLKAVIMVNISDLGLNMSDLTNCMTVWVTDPEHLPKDLLIACLAKLAEAFEGSQIPVLLFPETYAVSQQIEFEKRYALWILKLTDTDSFCSYIADLLKFFYNRRQKVLSKTIV